ncbi:MAG: hypothetical protein FWD42_08140 [Solirubrobacterales bacterium]|nr:hypothetical protein [Solirubrobacterales bacterium]
MRKLALPQFMKDANESMRASTPHLRAANEARARATSLLREIQDPNAQLSPEQRAERRRKIASLHEQARREVEVVHRLTAQLQTRLPPWTRIYK